MIKTQINKENIEQLPSYRPHSIESYIYAKRVHIDYWNVNDEEMNTPDFFVRVNDDLEQKANDYRRR